MNIHSCAKTCPASRLLLSQRIESGWSVLEAAEAAGVSERTGYKWLRRFREEGERGLRDRSSRPHLSPNRLCKERVATILKLRECRWTSPMIAEKLAMPTSTVARVLSRAGVSRLKLLEPKPVIRRYERSAPGELVDVDIKRLARFEEPGHRVPGDRRRDGRGRNRGYEYVHVAIDDYTRVAYIEVLTTAPATNRISSPRFARAKASSTSSRDSIGLRQTAKQSD